jgi:hypothetical protein
MFHHTRYHRFNRRCDADALLVRSVGERITGVAAATVKADKCNIGLHSLRTMRRKDTPLASCKF